MIENQNTLLNAQILGKIDETRVFWKSKDQPTYELRSVEEFMCLCNQAKEFKEMNIRN